MMEFKWIEKYYQDKRLGEYNLRNINFKVNDGEFVKINRPSGNSRSDLMYLFGSLNIESSNEYVFFDNSTIEDKVNLILELNNPHVGLILKRNYLPDKLTVYENIETPLVEQNVRILARKKRVNKVLKEFNLFSEKDFHPNQLSKYKQQMVSIARAVVGNPKLIIADDPCASLDRIKSNKLIEIMTKLNNEGITILLATSSSKPVTMNGKVINKKREITIN